MELKIYDKSGVQIASTGNFTYSAEAMGEKNISLTVESPVKIPFVPFCYVNYKSENYYLQAEAPGKRVAASGYKGDALQYNLTFKSKQTDLVNCDFLDFLLDGGQFYSGMGEFTFYGDVYDLARRIQASLNKEYTGLSAWTIKMPKTGYSAPQNISTIGISERSLDSSPKQITVSDENCWNALTRAFSDYGFNFFLDTTNREIFIGVTYPELSVGGENVVFEYGSGNGLYEINREIDDKGLITRLRAYGSDQNIPLGYMNIGQRVVSRLQLPSYRLTQTDESPVDYVMASPALVDYYGIRPGKQIFEDIKPTIKGIKDGNGNGIDTIHSVEAIDDTIDEEGHYVQPSFWVHLYDMGFDINQLLLPEDATLSMSSGYCGAVEFGIVEAVAVEEPGVGEEDVDFYYEGVRWKYRLEKNSSYSSNYILPSGNMLIVSGDTFTLLNISMPETPYVTAAEDRLLTAAQEHLTKNSKSKISYTVNLDEIYLAHNPLIETILREGTNVKIIDNDLGDTTDDNVTYYTIKSIQSLTIKHSSEKLLPTYNITLADGLVAGLIDIIQGEIKENVENVNSTIVQNGRDRRNAVRNTRNLRSLKDYTYDADGYFDVDRIKPLSIETKYLAVGAKSSNFSTNGVKGRTYTDTGYYINLTAGFINHREIWWTPVEIPPIDPLIPPLDGSERYSWAINTPLTFLMTDDTKPYYVFARSSQTTGLADWLVTTEQKQYKDADYYYFQLGTVEVPVEGRRDLIFVNGMAFISGGQIYGDNIQSINYSDDETNEGSKYGLNDGTIRIGNTTKGLTYTKDEGVKLYGALVQSQSGAEFPVGVFRGAYDPTFVYYEGDIVTYSGSSWIFINEVPATGETPSEGIYWSVWSAAGVDGADGEDGSEGANARAVNLTVAVQGFTYNASGTTPSPANTLVTATAINTTGTVYYEFFKDDVSVQNTTGNTYTYVPQAAYTNMPDKIEVQIREGAGTGTILARDQITIVGLKPGVAGADAITIVLSNEAHTLPTTAAGAVTYTGSGTEIRAWMGTQPMIAKSSNDFTYPTFWIVSKSGSNVTPGSTTVGSGVITIGNHSNMTANNAYVDITIGMNAPSGLTVVKRQSLAKSKAGATGSDGNSIEYRYAKNGSTTTAPTLSTTSLNPVGWSTTPPTLGALEYLWFTKAKKSYDGMTLIENWSAAVRQSGINGVDGNDGAVGPSPVYQGVYASGATYYGNSTRVDIVKYGATYYVARADAGTFSGVLPTSTTKWNTFGAQFESVATNLLFAELAYIENLGVKYLRTGTTGQRVFIDGSDGSMHFYDSAGTEILSLAAGIVTALAATIKSSTGSKRIEISTSTNELESYEGGALKVKIGSDVYPSYPGIGLKSGTYLRLESGAKFHAADDCVFIDSTYGTGLIKGAYASGFMFSPKIVSSHSEALNNSLYTLSGQLHYKRSNGTSVALS